MFVVPQEFGKIGAVLIENKHHSEMYLKNVVLGDDEITFTCESWIHSKHDNPDKRIFFTNKVSSNLKNTCSSISSV